MLIIRTKPSTNPSPYPLPQGEGQFFAILKSAAFAALITLGLGLPFLALQAAQDVNQEIFLNQRWDLWLAAGGIVFGVMLVWGVVRGVITQKLLPIEGGAVTRSVTEGVNSKNGVIHPHPPAAQGTSPIKGEEFLIIIKKSFPTLLLLFTLAYPFIFYDNRYLLDMGILILTYVMLGWGLNIVVGLAGLLDLGYVAFYAVGAYSYALLAQYYGLSFWICLPLAGILAAFFGILLGFPVLRLRGDYLAIVTMAFGEIIRIVLINWSSLTGGPNGISGIPRPSFFGLPFSNSDDGFAAFFGIEYSSHHRLVFFFYLILALALITNWVTLRLRKLPLGRAWEALREDEIACRSLGINITITKLSAFAIGAAFGGFAGCFFATRQGFVSPESFNFMESAFILAIVVLGGMGSQIGVAIAAALMISGLGLLRHLEFLKHIFGADFEPTHYRMLLFGLAMVAMVIWKPRGLVGNRTPSAFLFEQKNIAASHVKEGHG